MLRCIGFAAALLALLLLSGCISQELSIADRQACLELSSKSFAFVPSCETQDKCFDAVQQEFFGFDESVFSYNVREEIFSFKNRLAASWLFFNQARKSAQRIREICYSKQGTGDLPFHVNELNHSLRAAFQHADSAFQNAFSFVFLEARALEEDGVELVKEEQLFSGYIALNNNINDLGLKRSATGTFAAEYLRGISSLDSLVQETGFGKTIIQEKTLLDLLEPKTAAVSDQAQNYFSIKIPFLSDALSSFVSYLNYSLKVSQAASVLEEFPAFEFFQAYNSLCGHESSSAKKFSALVGETANARAVLIQRNSSMELALEQELAAISEGILELAPKAHGSIDQNLFAELFSLLGKSSEIAPQRFGISNLNDFQEKAFSQLDGLKQSFSSLKRAGFLGEISLGEKTVQLKRLLEEAGLLKDNLEYLGTEVVDGLLVLCEERSKQIASFVEGIAVPEQAFLAVSELRSRVKFKLEQFKQSSGDSKLFVCRDVLLEFSSLESALTDFHSFEAGMFSSFGECMKNASAVLSVASSEFDVSDFKRRIASIEAVAASGENIQSLERFCSSLWSDMQGFFFESPELRSFQQRYFFCRELLQKTVLLSASFPEIVPQKTLEEFKKKLSFFGNYFDATALKLDAVLPLFPELQSQLLALESDLNEMAGKAVAAVMGKTFSSTIFAEEVPKLGQKSYARVRIILENPMDFLVSSPQSIELPLGFDVLGIIDSSPNVLSVSPAGGKISIGLSSIPQGFAFVDLNSIAETSVEQELELLGVSQSQAIFKKTFSINNPSNIPRLLAELSLLEGSALSTNSCRVFLQETEIPFSKSGNKISLLLDNLQPMQKIVVFFSVDSPIAVETEVLERAAITQTRESYRLAVSIENRLPVAIKSASLKLPLKIEGNSITITEFVDSNGKKVKFEALSGKNLSVFVELLSPGQRCYLFASLEVENCAEYWQQQLQTQKDRAVALLGSDVSSIAEQANSILSEIGAFGERFFESNENIQQLLDAAKKLDALEAQNNDLFSKAEEFNALRESILEQLASMEQKAQLLSTIGFDSEAEKERELFQGAQKKLASAEELFANGELDSAMGKIFEINAALFEQGPFDAQEFLSEKKAALLGEAEPLLEQAKEIGADPTEFEKSLLLLATDFDSLLLQSKLVEAKEKLALLGEKIASFKENLGAFAKEKTDLIAGKIERLRALAENSLPALVSQATSLFEGIEESDLIAAKYVSPIGLSAIKKIALEMESLNSPLLEEKFADFFEAYNKGEYAKALLLANQFMPELEAKEKKATGFEKELSSKLDQVKEDATASHNAAVQALNNGTQSLNAAEALDGSETALKSQRYLDSIILSKKAVSLLSMPHSQAQLPVYLYPIIIAAMLVFVVRFRRKKSDGVKSKKIARVLSAWQD